MNDQSKAVDIRIGERLQQAESSLSQRTGRAIAAREICAMVRDRYGVPLSPSTYSLLRSDRRSPTVQQLVALARVFEVTPEFLLGEMSLEGSGGVRWARRTPALSPSRTRFAIALERLLGGHPFSASLCREVGLDENLLNTSDGREQLEWELGRLAQSAVFLGVAELNVGKSAVDEELSARVRDVLVNDSITPDALGSRLEVTVLGSPVHEDFCDGGHLGPLLVGNYGLGVLARYFSRNPHASHLGLAGGFHVASLVHQVGLGDLGWPERIYRVYPLTIEPFSKQIALADALVGELCHRLGALLGARSIHGHSLRAFGYLTDEGDIMLRSRSITSVLDQITDADAAVLGVGDSLTPDGSLQRVLAMQGYKLANPDRAVADVCLNPIDENGQRLSLRRTTKNIDQLVGVDPDQLRRMSLVDKNKLVLLLASGARKARSTRAIVRGGFVNHVLCDNNLAHAILALDDN
jgi:transcriptional regulator with XRE-family HTH domain